MDNEFFKKSIPSQIDESVVIGANCYVHQQNVKIGKNTIIQPNVTILGDVEIGENCSFISVDFLLIFSLEPVSHNWINHFKKLFQQKLGPNTNVHIF